MIRVFLVSLVVAGCKAKEPPPVLGIDALHAVDAERAILVVREGLSGRTSLVLMRRDGTKSWETALEPDHVPSKEWGITVGDDVVTIRGVEARTSISTGFALGDGRRLWRVELPDGGTPTDELPSVIDGANVIELSTNGTSTWVTAIDRRRGSVAWRRQLADQAELIEVTPLGLIFRLNGIGQNAVVVRRDTDTVTVKDGLAGCVLERSLVRLKPDIATRKHTIEVATLPRGLVPTITELPIDDVPEVADSWTSVVACGRYGRQLVFVVHRWTPGSRQRPMLWFVELGDDRARLVGTLALPVQELQTPLGSTRARGLYRGPLPRIAAFEDREGDGYVLVDLEARKVVQHLSRTRKDLVITQFERLPALPGFIVTDGDLVATISEAGAISAVKLNESQSLHPRGIAGIRYWIAGQSMRADLAFAVLDLRSSTLVGGNGVSVEPATSAFSKTP